ncbi:Uncharacterised protein [Staphylococcus epidermidis]|uniref:hypothetical protein n=1 Tax=Staphylococcus epidermidis TaxID=1282 RepID=UPI000E009B60|nr:hypothetical protein [Staphylococcus epidermidis]SUM53514.1 Uncharacterised protein [Staphylococcus epidermidis]SUM53525.1 Uncharacterised protein [Staphylococcus epidermidis]
MEHGSVDKYFKEIERGRSRQNEVSKSIEIKAENKILTLEQKNKLKKFREKQSNYNIYTIVQSDRYYIEYTDPEENEFNIIIHDIKKNKQFRTKFSQHTGLPLMLYRNGTMIYESGVIR